MTLLSLQNVSYQYYGTKKLVLKNVQAKFETGLLYAIMGKSGAGKTTLLSLISGLDLATSGLVSYNGIDIQHLDRDQYRAKDVGVIFQGYNLLLNATAVENIELSMYISGTKTKKMKKSAYTFLENVGIDQETANRKVLKLSGGEQQRVGIARALSHDPALIIADEPTGNLDSDTEENIMNIFKNIAHVQNKCVIIVTHSNKVAAYCDFVNYLDKGKLRLK